jgi:hypothetical protein
VLKSLLHKVILIACALHLSGAHWAVLQVTAWTGMLVARTQASGVAAAVATTFDGEHPCAMCNAITAGQQEEKQTEFPALKAMEEIRLVLADRVTLPQRHAAGGVVWPDFLMSDLQRTDAPPVPPPLT